MLKLVILLSTLVMSIYSFAEPYNLTLLRYDIINYHDSGSYENELAKVISKAQEFILHQKQINHKEHPRQKLAIVLDIDETSLSNYNSMVKRDFTGTHAEFHQDILNANAPAIKSTLALYQAAIHQGIKVFFVTGRHQSERNATTKNLLNAGYTQWSGLYLCPDAYKAQSIVPFKSHARELITQQGYLILATIGDQFSDLKGGFAKKGFKLPNPYYYLP